MLNSNRKNKYIKFKAPKNKYVKFNVPKNKYVKFNVPKNKYVKFKAPKNIYKSKNKIYSRIFKKKTKYIQYKKAKILKLLL